MRIGHHRPGTEPTRQGAPLDPGGSLRRGDRRAKGSRSSRCSLPRALAGVVFTGVLLEAGAVGASALTLARREPLVWRALWAVIARAALCHRCIGRMSLPWIVGLGAAGLCCGGRGQVLLAGPRRRLPLGWLIAAVDLTIGLGALLVRAGPHAATMVLSLFVARDLLVFGLALIVIRLTGRAGATLL